MQMTSPGPPAINSPSAGRGAYAIRVRPQEPCRRVGSWAPPGVASGPRLRGSAFGLSPGRGPRFRGAGIISARTPVPYPRTKTTSCVPDTRLMASRFSQAQPHQLQNLFGLGGRRAGDAGEKQLVMVRESAIEQRPTLWSAKIVLHWEGKGEASVCPCF